MKKGTYHQPAVTPIKIAAVTMLCQRISTCGFASNGKFEDSRDTPSIVFPCMWNK